jgi:hypothetical protein
MSTDFRLRPRIFACDLFGGRLAKFGVREWVAPQQDHTDGQVDDLWFLSSQDDHKRTLVDAQGNYVWVYIDDNGTVTELTRYGHNDANVILAAAAEAFETKIFSEHEPQFWGFETEEELLAHISLARNEAQLREG